MQSQQLALRPCRLSAGARPLRARPSGPARAAPRAPACRAGGSQHMGAGGHELPSAWVARCLERAQNTAVLLDGKHYIPLSEAQRWFEAGVHEGDTEHAQRLHAVLAEQSRLESEMEAIAREAEREHSEHEKGMRRLLSYAVALESELEGAKKGMDEAVLEATHAAEEKLLLQYQQMLIEYEAAHEAESHAVEQSLRGQVQHLETMLRAAHEAKKQWRERALQAEQQFSQLRSLIQVGLRHAVEQAQWEAAGRDQAQGQHNVSPAHNAHKAPAASAHASASCLHAEEEEAEDPPPPVHASPRMRSSDAVSSADADVAAAHPLAGVPAAGEAAGHKAAGKAKRKLRRGSPEGVPSELHRA